MPVSKCDMGTQTSLPTRMIESYHLVLFILQRTVILDSGSLSDIDRNFVVMQELKLGKHQKAVCVAEFPVFYAGERGMRSDRRVPAKL